jgi:uncharacterized C2H2 Zn-finger protein
VVRDEKTADLKGEEKTLACLQCDARFCSSVELFEHQREVHKVKQGALRHVCPRCGERFSSFPEFKDHLFFTHGEETNFPCPCCDSSYTTKRSVRKHIRKKHLGSTAVCKHCGKTFNNGWQLYLHHEEVHAVEEPTTAASVSERIGTGSCDPLIACTDSNVADTKAKVTDMEVKVGDTEVILADTEAIVPDMETIVPDTEAILPDTDADASQQEAIVTDKPASVGKVSQFKGSCDDCGRTYTSRDLLVGHAYRVHGKTLPGLKMYTCPVCDKLFHMRLQFQAHFRRVCSKIATQEQDFQFVQILRKKIVRTRTAKVLKKKVVKEKAAKVPKRKVGKDKTAKVPKENVETSVADVPAENRGDKVVEVTAENVNERTAEVLNKKGKPREHCGKNKNDRRQHEVHTIRGPTTVLENVLADGCDALVADMEANVSDRAAGIPRKMIVEEKPAKVCKKIVKDKPAEVPKFVIGKAAEVPEQSVRQDTVEVSDKVVDDKTAKHLVKASVENVRVPCPSCGATFKTKRSLREHINRKHEACEESLRFPCPSCDATFKEARYLRKHVKSEHVGTTTICEHCGESFDDAWQLYLHQRKVHAMWAPTAVAPVVKKIVRNKAATVTKQNSKGSVADVPAESSEGKAAKVLNKPGRPRKCPVCCIIMSNLVYRNHFKIAHAGVPYQPAVYLYPCHKCYTLCKNQDKLDCHLTRKHGEEKKYVCDECGEKFAYKSAWFVHVRNRHTEEACVCEECGETFDRKYKLTMHKTRKHPRGPTRTYWCPECVFPYTTREGLAKHNAVAHGIGKISRFNRQCEDCGQKFVFEDHLRAHAYKKHGKTLPGLKMFTCPVCCKLFHVKVLFRIHVETHSKLMKSKSRKK